MSKKISKNYWVSEDRFNSIASGCQSKYHGWGKNSTTGKKVTISWEEPEKVIRLSESDLDKAYEEIMKEKCQYIGFQGARLADLRKKLFGEKGE